MNQLDWFVVLVAAVVGVAWDQRVAWGILGVLAIARLLQVA